MSLVLWECVLPLLQRSINIASSWVVALLKTPAALFPTRPINYGKQSVSRCSYGSLLELCLLQLF